MMKTRDVFIVGFMLFSMFFGAGNLIFPPALGYQSGEFFWPAIFGFVLTGVGLPLLSILVGSISENGYRDSLKVIHPVFSVVFLVIIYLTIGPFFAIPRNATTAYEMGVVPFIDRADGLSLLLFSIVFFGIVLYLSLSPGDLSDTLGKYLTPVLLIVILLLIVRAVMLYFTNDPQTADPSFTADSPFIIGFTEGYLTMDAIAGLAFSLVVLSSIRAIGVTEKRALLSGTGKAAVLAAVLLGLIYTGLGWAGNRVMVESGIPENLNAGTYLLQFVSGEAFGALGDVLLGIIVLLACLTTAVGLIASVSEYFNSLIPAVSYKAFAILFSVISLILSNQGLDQVIQTSVPVLNILYPVAISAMILLAVTYFVPSPRISLQLPILLVSAASILSVAHSSGWVTFAGIESLPMYHYQLEWVPLLIAGFLIGYVIGWKNERVRYG